MVGRVAGPQIAEIPRFEFGVVRRQRSEADRRHETVLHDVHDRFPVLPSQHRVRQRDRKDLIGSTLPVDAARSAVLGVDDVV